MADSLFVDPNNGDYTVKPESQALQIGFKNFPLDQFGVVTPRLRALAKSPIQKRIPEEQDKRDSARDQTIHFWLGATIKNLSDLGEISATGMSGATGILMKEVPDKSEAGAIGLQPMDVITALDGKKIDAWSDFSTIFNEAPQGKKMNLKIFRNQQELILSLNK